MGKRRVFFAFVLFFLTLMLVAWWGLAQTPSFAESATAEQRDIRFLSPRKYHGEVVRSVSLPNGEKVIALTFDDGPWGKSTEEVLKILETHGVKATFFVVGRHMQLYPTLTQKIVDAGHGVANHTWNHDYHKVDPGTAAKEVENTSALIAKQATVQTRLFRPPGGILDNGLVDYAAMKRYAILLWSVDPADTAPDITSEKIVARVMKDTRPGGIILLHDGGGDRRATIKALPTIISRLKKQGYTFVTISELLELSVAPPPLPEPPPEPTPEPLLPIPDFELSPTPLEPFNPDRLEKIFPLPPLEPLSTVEG
ncbi:polysaccharide deacetylase family protein [Candidatus Synechococcus calcipolaris G9]|uniref:Polysaccharide deacetylase family protein n=1 Tax=Candidatus Synechococcus calcipolaris G9 TaxID=1497997 RepID=A0ABT6EXP3_9SYNE|nr:polysaccharide deacetylase family protein [Candidatus Synechococcus calcipolaris]MDG2990571.1 polysaccharide deacetylase family protein [Candidatus Synechococcus calcipolaris G9]